MIQEIMLNLKCCVTVFFQIDILLSFVFKTKFSICNCQNYFIVSKLKIKQLFSRELPLVILVIIFH